MDDADPDHVVIVGKITPPGTVPVGPGEAAVRMRRQVIVNEIAIRMIYDDEGHFIRPEQVDDLRRYQEIRDRALRHTTSLNEYLRTREPRLIA